MALIRLLLVAIVVALAPGAHAKDGDSRFAALDDFLVHYKSWGKPDGPAVILIHGFTLDHSFWNHQVPALAKGHRVIALDLPGHGQSAKPRDIVYTQTLFARAVEAVATDAGVSRAALVGHSMGLPVIHTVIRRGRLAVDRAVFIDGAIVVKPADPKARAATEQWAAGMVKGLGSPSHDLVLEQFLLPMLAMTPADERKRVLAKSRATESHVAASTFEHIADDEVWAPARFDLPVLALYAKVSSPGVKEWLAANYPRARLVVWNDVDHFPHLAKPERVNRELVNFLR